MHIKIAQEFFFQVFIDFLLGFHLSFPGHFLPVAPGLTESKQAPDSRYLHAKLLFSPSVYIQ